MGNKIVVTGMIPQVGIDMLTDVGEVFVWDGDGVIPVDVLARELADADAAVTLLPNRVDDAFLDLGPTLQVVANLAVGYNNIDVAACSARGVTVTNTPGVLTDATADIAMSLILMVTRRLGEAERFIREQRPWRFSMFMLLGHSIEHKRLGVIGMGAIGAATARRAKAFGMEIVYHNRSRVDPAIEAELGAQLVSLDELLATSDVVSINAPYSPETHHLINADALATMKPSAYLINTARGAMVDEAALVEALSNGTIAGAGLDVFENEPRVHPGLLELDNVALLPHIGSATVETRNAMAELAARNVIEVLAGRPPLTPVSPHHG